MFICICNSKKDADLKEALDSGASTYCAVMKYWQTKPQCGKCKFKIVEEIKNKSTIEFKKAS